MHGEESVEYPRGTRASAFISHLMLIKTCTEHRPSPPAKVERNQVNTAINYSFPIMLQKIRTGHYVQIPTPRLSSLASLVSVNTAQTKSSKRNPKIQISKEEQHSFVRGE